MTNKDSKTVACNGDAQSPHPKVYLTYGSNGKVICPYCGKVYTQKKG